jgi:hypothetical protein
MSPAAALVLLSNAFCVVLAGHAALILRRAAPDAASGRLVMMVVAAAFAVGLANSFLPPLLALRAQVFIAQPAMILGLTLALIAVGATAVARRYFAAADIWTILPIYLWRAPFGVLLLLTGLSGGLPAGFFWTAAAGDIAVGLWALSMLRRRETVGATELTAWNLAGIADFVHVLALGVIHLRGFHAANPEITPLGLLPFFGVPLMLALHIHLFRTLRGLRAGPGSLAARRA